MAKIKMTDDNKRWWACREAGNSPNTAGGTGNVQLPWKVISQLLKMLNSNYMIQQFHSKVYT